MEVSVAVYLLASAVVVGLFLLWLDRRVAGVSVLLDGDQLHVRNVFRSYRHPNASVTRVVSRRAWFGSVYASCLAVHTSARIAATSSGEPVHIVGLMANWDTVCEIASSLPGAQLDGPHAEAPAWRVNGKVIVRRNPRLDDTAKGEDEVIAIRTDDDERAALLEEDPATFFLTDHWARSRNTSVLVQLATVSREQLAELITEAWRRRATKRQRLQH